MVLVYQSRWTRRRPIDKGQMTTIHFTREPSVKQIVTELLIFNGV